MKITTEEMGRLSDIMSRARHCVRLKYEYGCGQYSYRDVGCIINGTFYDDGISFVIEISKLVSQHNDIVEITLNELNMEEEEYKKHLIDVAHEKAIDEYYYFCLAQDRRKFEMWKFYEANKSNINTTEF